MPIEWFLLTAAVLLVLLIMFRARRLGSQTYSHGELPTTWQCAACRAVNWLAVKNCFNCGAGQGPEMMEAASARGAVRDLVGHPGVVPIYGPPEGEVVIRNYPGRTQADASTLFAKDARQLASYGYRPVSQSWADGRPGLKRVAAIGVFSLAARPPGTLTVTYQRVTSLASPATSEMTCPRCAETIKAAALVCRFCGHDFTASRLEQ